MQARSAFSTSRAIPHTTLDRSKGGLGLGLALVKGLVELHGGTVKARSAGPAQGSEFLLQLPLVAVVPEPKPRQGEATSPREAKGKLRVLLVEDNVDAAETLKEALELNGHEVAVAISGHEGLDRARQFGPDVVVCDIGPPGMDGFEVARRMRADPVLNATHLVALSGYAAPEDLERSREAGFAQHLVKPPDLLALEGTLSEVWDARRGVEAG